LVSTSNAILPKVMITEIVFTKASGAGNDFIIIDNRDDGLPVDKATLAQRLCSRHFGIGADGLLLVESSSKAHFMMKYYNSDGSFGGMCGNGGRCIARYAFIRGIAPSELLFEALDFTYHAEVLDQGVCLTMKDPRGLKHDIDVRVGHDTYHGSFVNTGSPHFVTFVDDVMRVPVEMHGRSIRLDPMFSPEGTNVNFVQVTDPNIIRLRTYERGVEIETLACGTGSVASGIISHLFKGQQFPITVQVQSGESLKVSATVEANQIRSPKLEGSAHILFAGRLLYDVDNQSIVEAARIGASEPA
jgi:diaminopimelate epimerase